VTVDRDAIQRRDFPVVESGYEPAAVDAHLGALADELERLRESAGGARSAGTHIQSVLEAAQHAAAEIEAEARRRAEETGAEAIADTRAHVEALTGAAQALRDRLSELDAEIGELIAAAQRLSSASAAPKAAVTTARRKPATPAPAAPQAPKPPAAAQPADAAAAQTNGDLDGARLVALNMALNGESREATERYLAERFHLSDRDKLIDEVYSAVEE
jgi:polyhydroxyalkanoate synthesis regulator phasin